VETLIIYKAEGNFVVVGKWRRLRGNSIKVHTILKGTERRDAAGYLS